MDEGKTWLNADVCLMLKFDKVCEVGQKNPLCKQFFARPRSTVKITFAHPYFFIDLPRSFS
jgi:hypothetical protein